MLLFCFILSNLITLAIASTQITAVAGINTIAPIDTSSILYPANSSPCISGNIDNCPPSTRDVAESAVYNLLNTQWGALNTLTTTINNFQSALGSQINNYATPFGIVNNDLQFSANALSNALKSIISDRNGASSFYGETIDQDQSNIFSAISYLTNQVTSTLSTLQSVLSTESSSEYITQDQLILPQLNDAVKSLYQLQIQAISNLLTLKNGLNTSTISTTQLSSDTNTALQSAKASVQASKSSFNSLNRSSDIMFGDLVNNFTSQLHLAVLTDLFNSEGILNSSVNAINTQNIHDAMGTIGDSISGNVSNILESFYAYGNDSVSNLTALNNILKTSLIPKLLSYSNSTNLNISKYNVSIHSNVNLTSIAQLKILMNSVATLMSVTNMVASLISRASASSNLMTAEQMHSLDFIQSSSSSITQNVMNGTISQLSNLNSNLSAIQSSSYNSGVVFEQSITGKILSQSSSDLQGQGDKAMSIANAGNALNTQNMAGMARSQQMGDSLGNSVNQISSVMQGVVEDGFSTALDVQNAAFDHNTNIANSLKATESAGSSALRNSQTKIQNSNMNSLIDVMTKSGSQAIDSSNSISTLSSMLSSLSDAQGGRTQAVKELLALVVSVVTGHTSSFSSLMSQMGAAANISQSQIASLQASISNSMDMGEKETMRSVSDYTSNLMNSISSVSNNVNSEYKTSLQDVNLGIDSLNNFQNSTFNILDNYESNMEYLNTNLSSTLNAFNAMAQSLSNAQFMDATSQVPVFVENMGVAIDASSNTLMSQVQTKTQSVLIDMNKTFVNDINNLIGMVAYYHNRVLIDQGIESKYQSFSDNQTLFINEFKKQTYITNQFFLDTIQPYFDRLTDILQNELNWFTSTNIYLNQKVDSINKMSDTVHNVTSTFVMNANLSSSLEITELTNFVNQITIAVDNLWGLFEKFQSDLALRRLAAITGISSSVLLAKASLIASMESGSSTYGQKEASLAAVLNSLASAVILVTSNNGVSMSSVVDQINNIGSGSSSLTGALSMAMDESSTSIRGQVADASMNTLLSINSNVLSAGSSIETLGNNMYGSLGSINNILSSAKVLAQQSTVNGNIMDGLTNGLTLEESNQFKGIMSQVGSSQNAGYDMARNSLSIQSAKINTVMDMLNLFLKAMSNYQESNIINFDGLQISISNYATLLLNKFATTNEQVTNIQSTLTNFTPPIIDAYIKYNKSVISDQLLINKNIANMESMASILQINSDTTKSNLTANLNTVNSQTQARLANTTYTIEDAENKEQALISVAIDNLSIALLGVPYSVTRQTGYVPQVAHKTNPTSTTSTTTNTIR